MEVESICKKMAEDWIDGGCGPNLFEVSVSTICGYIVEKKGRGHLLECYGKHLVVEWWR